MRGFVGDKGYTIPITLVKDDGVTPFALNGKTIKWSFKFRDGSIPTGSPITGNIVSPTEGEVNFVIPESILAGEQQLESQITPEEGTTEIGPSSEPFIFSVDPTAKAP